MMTTNGLPEESAEEHGAVDFPRIFDQYVETLEALRDFFSQLNPVVAGLRQSAVDERRRIIVQRVEAFRADADESMLAEAEILAPLIEAMIDASFASATPMEKPTTDSGATRVEINNPAVRHLLSDVLDVALRPVTASQHQELLNRAVLSNLVSSFEVLLADLVHCYFRLHPDATSGDEKVLSVNELREFESIGAAFSFVVSRRVDDLLRGSLEDWVSFFRSRLKIDLNALVPDAAAWAEMFQRRHLMLHAAGVVNRRYLERVEWEKLSINRPSVGDQLTVDDDYLGLAINLFEVAGALLCQATWKKLQPHEVDRRLHVGFLHQGLHAVIYRSLCPGRWPVGEALALWASKSGDGDESDQLLGRFNHWLCVKRQGRLVEIAADLENFDCSAKHPKFALAWACLREQRDDFFELVDSALNAGVTKRDIVTWPIFEEIRDDPRYGDLLERIPDDGAPSYRES